MSYIQWFEQHAHKHKLIVDKLVAKNYTKEQIIHYFEFEHMLKNEPDFCPLYKENKKCHDMENLNCYLCACPNFRFNDEGIKKENNKTQYSFCSINSKDGTQGVYGDKIHQDCSRCTIPHVHNYIKQRFDYDWEKIMYSCSM